MIRYVCFVDWRDHDDVVEVNRCVGDGEIDGTRETSLEEGRRNIFSAKLVTWFMVNPPRTRNDPKHSHRDITVSGDQAAKAQPLAYSSREYTPKTRFIRHTSSSHAHP